VRVIRTVIEVAGHTSLKPFPETPAGWRTIRLLGWLVELYRRTLFHCRVWRPALILTGLLGLVEPRGDKFRVELVDAAGLYGIGDVRHGAAAMNHVARSPTGGLRFRDLWHSYATWVVDDGAPVNIVRRVLGHERPSTTPDFYTRRIDDPGESCERSMARAAGGFSARVTRVVPFWCVFAPSALGLRDLGQNEGPRTVPVRGPSEIGGQYWD
jgi:integrase